MSAIANRKGLTVAQLCIAWVGALGDRVIPLPGSSFFPSYPTRSSISLSLIVNARRGCFRNAKRTLETSSAGDVELSSEDLAEIAQLLEKYPRKGPRYVDNVTEEQLHLWSRVLRFDGNEGVYGTLYKLSTHSESFSFWVCVPNMTDLHSPRTPFHTRLIRTCWFIEVPVVWPS